MAAKTVKVRPRVFDVDVQDNSGASDPVPPSEEFRDELPILGESESPVAVQTEVYTNITLRLPHSLYEEYDKVGTLQGQPVEEVMIRRLLDCRTHNALRGLWFSDSERAQLETLLQKRPITSAAQVLTTLTNLGSMNVEGLSIVLTPAQRKVLGLAMYGGRTPQKFFEDMIRRELRV